MLLRTLLLLVVLARGGVAHADPGAAVLAKVNGFRAAAGLPAVVLDPQLSKGCMEHATYMKLNRRSPAMQGLEAHKQNPRLPGASKAGAACAKDADLFPGVGSLEGAVDGWMSGLYHRRPILDPELARIGLGYARNDDGSFMVALMLVDDDGSNEELWPVAYPADGQGGAPLGFGDEVPDPVPGGGAAGYPITLQFPAFAKVTGVKATLTSGKKEVPFHLSDPEHPATSFGQYGVVCLIPREPLRPSTTYRVTVDAVWEGKPQHYSWSFTTTGLRVVAAADEAQITAALGVPSLVRGKVLHGGLMDAETAFLQIGTYDYQKLEMVSVLIPVAVWREMGVEPDELVGKTVEVEGTPELVAAKYVNVVIGLRRQLKVVKE